MLSRLCTCVRKSQKRAIDLMRLPKQQKQKKITFFVAADLSGIRHVTLSMFHIQAPLSLPVAQR
jgi:hypothetical protein